MSDRWHRTRRLSYRPHAPRYSALVLESLEERCCLSVSFDIAVVALTGNADGLTAIGSRPAINDFGVVAFKASSIRRSDGATVENLYTVDTQNSPASRLRPLVPEDYLYPSSGPVPYQTFSDDVQITTESLVVAKRTLGISAFTSELESISPELTYLEQWQSDRTDVPVRCTIMGDGGLVEGDGIAEPIDAISDPCPVNIGTGYHSIHDGFAANNNGDVIFTGNRSDGDYISTGLHPNFPFLGQGPIDWHPQASMSDDGTAVLRGDYPEERQLLVVSFNLVSIERVARASNGFSDIGERPSITSVGTSVAFYGSLTDAGAQALNAMQSLLHQTDGSPLSLTPLTPGPGIFVAVRSDQGWVFQRAAGIAGNGFLDPGETFNDADGDGVFDGPAGNEIDQGLIGSFDADARVSIANGLSENLSANTIAFIGSDASGTRSVFSVQMSTTLDSMSSIPTGGMQVGDVSLVIHAGQSLTPSNSDSMQIVDLSLGRAVNRAGQIVLWAKTNQGEAVLQATPSQNPIMRGDFNGDSLVDKRDLDLMWEQLGSLTPELRFDLTGDNRLDASDRDMMIFDIMKSTYGDADLNGVFDSSDLVQVFQVGKYESGIPGGVARWGDGDWDGDGEFTSSDLVLAFQTGGYEKLSGRLVKSIDVGVIGAALAEDARP